MARGSKTGPVLYKIKVFRLDNAAEYVRGKVTDDWTRNHPWKERPNTPQQNGVAERENRTVVEMARLMLYARKSKLPRCLWEETIAYVTYILKRMPSSKSTSCPFEKWNGTFITSSNLWIKNLSPCFGRKTNPIPNEMHRRSSGGLLRVFQGLPCIYPNTKVLVSLDSIIDETRGYEGEIPYPNAIDSLVDSQIQIDPYHWTGSR